MSLSNEHMHLDKIPNERYACACANTHRTNLLGYATAHTDKNGKAYANHHIQEQHDHHLGQRGQSHIRRLKDH